jgi:radical SAM protein with 4Fe4S-binding SPASM domain
MGEDASVPLPRRLQVEVTGACNLRCQMCLVAHRPPLAIRRASMTVERLRALLDELPDLEELTLQGLGEPLLAPDLFAMIAEAKSRGVRVGFNTNAMLLTAERSERLVELDVDWLHVSIDGASPETFAEIRVGGRLEQVVENLRTLVQIRARRGCRSPRIQLNTVLMRCNHLELPAIVELAASIGVDRMWVQRLSHDLQDVRDDSGYESLRVVTDAQLLGDEDVEPVLEAAAAIGLRHGLDLRLPAGAGGGGRTRRCDWPWTASYVTHDGAVQPCCMVMGSDRVTLGSVARQSFTEIWTGATYDAFRQRLSSNDPPAVCAGCSVYNGRF